MKYERRGEDLQGDVIALLDDSNSIVVEYKYDAWGALLGKTGTLAGTLGTLNPFRYRGYVYDEETKLYYLRSRYYNPEWGRFTSADEDLAGGHKLLGRNLMIYAANNPINCADTNGKKTYFINGINNSDSTEDDDFIPEYARKFEREYENNYDDDVVCIPVFISGDTLSGVSEVLQETIGNDVYTEEIVTRIREDIAQTPLRPGEKITLVGYSGGGILAANASTHLDHVDTIVFIGAPLLFPTIKADKAVNVWAFFDLFSSRRTGYMENYHSGFHGHTDYFSDKYLPNIIKLIRSYS